MTVDQFANAEQPIKETREFNQLGRKLADYTGGSWYSAMADVDLARRLYGDVLAVAVIENIIAGMSWNAAVQDAKWAAAPLAPANNTEARQQAAADLEQAEPEAMTATEARAAELEFANAECCICGSRGGPMRHRLQPSGQVAHFHAAVCNVILAGYDGETSQSDLFAARVDDLPIFSGTAPRATVRPFVETPASPRQPKLF